jgi:hypothetical protein
MGRKRIMERRRMRGGVGLLVELVVVEVGVEVGRRMNEDQRSVGAAEERLAVDAVGLGLGRAHSHSEYQQADLLDGGLRVD